MTILPVTTSAEIQPWKGTPWDGEPWEGTPWQGNPFEEKEGDNKGQLDPEVLEKLEEKGWKKEDLEELRYTGPELWEFLTSKKEWSHYFQCVGKGLKETGIGLWEWTKDKSSSTWNYFRSGEIWSDSQQFFSDSYHYFSTGEVFQDIQDRAYYQLSGQSWRDTKEKLSSAWNYSKNIGSYLFSKQMVDDAYQYITSGEVLMDYAEDFEAFATGYDPETQTSISGGERLLAAGSLFFKPLKAAKKLDRIGRVGETGTGKSNFDKPVAGDNVGVNLRSKGTGIILNSFDDVANHVSKNGKLPDNYITKKEARKLGWNPREGNLAGVAPGKSIGGDIFKNKENLLPSSSGRVWYEADINYTSGFRGGERLLYSSDGLIYKTTDHYKTFTRIK